MLNQSDYVVVTSHLRDEATYFVVKECRRTGLRSDGWIGAPEATFRLCSPIGPHQMELRHFRYFLAVAEGLHFARAAARLGIEQSPLSRQIRDLESDLKVRLFERTRRAMSLTKAGEQFLADARRILHDVDGSVRAVRAFASGGQPIRLGLTEWVGGPAFSRLMRLCRDAEPRIDLVLTESASAKARLRQLANGQRSQFLGLAAHFNSHPSSHPSMWVRTGDPTREATK